MSALRPSGVTERPIDVVLVEDDCDYRELLALLLGRAGCVVRAFADVQSAHGAILAHLPDVVLTDLHLTCGLSGSALAAMLRTEPTTSHVALIAVTGDGSPGREHAEYFDTCLLKPVDLDVLLAEVRTFAAKARTRWRLASVTAHAG